MRKILIVDDEENIRELIKFNLETAGFTVETAADGREALEKLDSSVELVVLDLMLPELDGLSVCRQIRSDPRYSSLPIIMLTARGEELDRVLGLEMGADDYLTKPFSPRELLARIKAVFRRVDLPPGGLQTPNQAGRPQNQGLVKSGGLELDLNSYEAKLNGLVLELTPKEFDLLRYLLINAGNVLSRNQLLEKIWGYEYAGDTRTVDVHIRRLRKKIGEEYINTVRGVGYKFAKLD